MKRPVLSAVIAASLWGTTGTAAFFLGQDAPPLAIGAVAMGMGGLVLAILGGKQTLTLWRDTRVRKLLIVGSIGTTIYPLAFYSGMANAGIALGNVIALGLGPLTAAVLEWAVDGRRPGRSWWIASSAAVAGITMMTASKVELGDGRPSNVALGISLATLAGLSYGLYTYVFGKLAGYGHTNRAVSGGVFGASAPPLLIVLLATGAPLFTSVESVSLVVYLVAGPMVIAYLAFTAALTTLRASSVATIALLEPVIATGLAVLVVGEVLGIFAVIGIALVTTALFAFSAKQHPGIDN